MSKPWAPSHVSEVAKGIGVDKRISGDVKKTLVELLNIELNSITENMEKKILLNDSKRKTLGDPERTRLSYSRTRGLMVDKIQKLDSVGSSAVVSANEILEKYLQRLLSYASDSADSDKMGTIMQRHLDSALEIIGKNKINIQTDEMLNEKHLNNDSRNNITQKEIVAPGDILSKANIRMMVRDIEGMKIEEDAIEDLLLVYYDHAAGLQEDFQNIVTKGSMEELEINVERSRTLMKMGWLRRMLKHAANNAKSDNSAKILLKHVIRIDPWE